jgi:transposase
MRGGDVRTAGLFSYVSCEGRVPSDHPLRRILPLVDAALTDLSVEFGKLYAPIGRPSIPPEKLLRALLLQAFYSIRAPTHGAAGLQPAVPLVHRPRHR